MGENSKLKPKFQYYRILFSVSFSVRRFNTAQVQLQCACIVCSTACKLLRGGPLKHPGSLPLRIHFVHPYARMNHGCQLLERRSSPDLTERMNRGAILLPLQPQAFGQPLSGALPLRLRLRGRLRRSHRSLPATRRLMPPVHPLA